MSVGVSCFGEVLIDLLDVGGLASPATSWRATVGGAAANVAIGVARLGVEPAVLGVVGDDPFGELALRELEGEGVDVSALVRVPARTPLAFVTRDARGEARFVPYREGTADARLEPAQVRKAASPVGVLATTSLLGPRGLEAAEAFVEAIRKAKGIVIVDLNVRPSLGDAATLRAAAARLVRGAHVVKASEPDLAAIAGKRGLSWLEANAKGTIWALTRGESGAAALGPFGQVTAPTRRVRAVDTSGAGDAFVAGLAATLAKAGAGPGDDLADPKLWQRAVEIGQLLGGKAVLADGATSGLVGLDEVRARFVARAGGEASAKKPASRPSAPTKSAPAKKVPAAKPSAAKPAASKRPGRA